MLGGGTRRREISQEIQIGGEWREEVCSALFLCFFFLYLLEVFSLLSLHLLMTDQRRSFFFFLGPSLSIFLFFVSFDSASCKVGFSVLLSLWRRYVLALWSPNSKEEALGWAGRDWWFVEILFFQFFDTSSSGRRRKSFDTHFLHNVFHCFWIYRLFKERDSPEV